MTDPSQDPATYDSMYEDGGYLGVYDLPYSHSHYYPLFRNVLSIAKSHNVKSILEVGCGTGAFAHLLTERSTIAYKGFDFSETAIVKADRRVGRSDLFYQGDARNPASYAGTYDTIVCTEVLEHIEDDLPAMALWPPETFCICSVPNYDSETHVRYFRNEEEVRERYSGVIDIEGMIVIKKPVLSDISLRSRLRALRWNRYRPRNLLTILGLGDFDEVGGWFLFHGRKTGPSAKEN
jgi:SAM-dependent methyltransferase